MSEDTRKETPLEQVDRWRNRIKDAKAYREQVGKNQEWERFQQEYIGKYDVGPLGQNMTIIPINLVFAFVHTEIPRLYFRDPYIAVNPK